MEEEKKNVISPFSVREGEIKVFDGKEGYASLNQVVFKMDMGYIGKEHIEVLKIINDLTFATSKQIMQLLILKGFLTQVAEEKKQDKVSKYLEDLIKSKVLTRYYFKTEGGQSSFRVYALDRVATYILKQQNVDVHFDVTENSKPGYALKRKLAANQVVIEYMKRAKNYVAHYPLVMYSKKYGAKFKPTGYVVEFKDQKEKYILEVVRQQEEWQNLLEEKITLYQDFFENFSPNDEGFKEKPKIVFVCEDINHIAEVFKIVKKIWEDSNDEDIYYTTEMKCLELDLTKTLMQFNRKEEGKYKLEVKELEMLQVGKKEENTELKIKNKIATNTIIE